MLWSADNRVESDLRAALGSLIQADEPWDEAGRDRQAAIDADFSPPSQSMDAGGSVRLWRNQRCVVASRAQSAMPRFEAARRLSDAAGWPVMVRRSGGGAVVHRPGILNVSRRKILSPDSRSWMTSGYQDFLDLLVKALGELGVACDHGRVFGSYCDGRFNLRCQGRKLAGTAAYAGFANGLRYCVFHASIVVSGSLEDDLAAIERFENGLGMNVAYDRTAHVSLSEAVHVKTAGCAPLAMPARAIHPMITGEC